MPDLQHHETIPAFEAPQWAADGTARPLNADKLKWGGLEKNGTATPPALGTNIFVTMNKLGPGIVRGYFTEGNWLGLRVEFTDPPAWWIRQNEGARPLGYIFGPEYRVVE